jgi:hypothetical protein
MKQEIPKDIRALLPVEEIITRYDRIQRARLERSVALVIVFSGWVFFALALLLH